MNLLPRAEICVLCPYNLERVRIIEGFLEGDV